MDAPTMDALTNTSPDHVRARRALAYVSAYTRDDTAGMARIRAGLRDKPRDLALFSTALAALVVELSRDLAAATEELEKIRHA